MVRACSLCKNDISFREPVCCMAPRRNTSQALNILPTDVELKLASDKRPKCDSKNAVFLRLLVTCFPGGAVASHCLAVVSAPTSKALSLYNRVNPPRRTPLPDEYVSTFRGTSVGGGTYTLHVVASAVVLALLRQLGGELYLCDGCGTSPNILLHQCQSAPSFLLGSQPHLTRPRHRSEAHHQGQRRPPRPAPSTTPHSRQV